MADVGTLSIKLDTQEAEASLDKLIEKLERVVALAKQVEGTDVARDRDNAGDLGLE